MLYDIWLAFKNDNTATKTRTNQAVILEEVEDPRISALYDPGDNGENIAKQRDTRSEDHPHEECCTSPSLLDTCNLDDTINGTGTQNKDNSCNEEDPTLTDEPYLLDTFEEPCASSSRVVYTLDQEGTINGTGTIKGTGTRNDNTCNVKDPTLKDHNTFEEPCTSSTHLVTSEWCDQENTTLRTPEQQNTLNDHNSYKDPCITLTNLDTSNRKDVTVQNDEVGKKSPNYTARELVKQCVLYPGKVVPKQTKKAMYIPSIITSNKWVDIMEAAENENKEKQVKKKQKRTKIKAKKKKVSMEISSSEEDGEVVEAGSERDGEVMKAAENKKKEKRANKKKKR